jgi:hypothetical protein
MLGKKNSNKIAKYQQLFPTEISDFTLIFPEKNLGNSPIILKQLINLFYSWGYFKEPNKKKILFLRDII